MSNVIATVSELTSYPIKSMAGLSLTSVQLGWHGFEGDRRFAFRKRGDTSGFPWLSASRLPEMVCYQPLASSEPGKAELPLDVRTPDGRILKVPSLELEAEISQRLGEPVEWMHLKHGIFDDATVSLLALSTVHAIGEHLRQLLDRRRFRANLYLQTTTSTPFCEDDWVGGTLVFGNGVAAPSVQITKRDVRCAMINIDPDTGHRDPRVMRSVAELNDNHAGVYATVVRPGMIHVGDPVFWFSAE